MGDEQLAVATEAPRATEPVPSKLAHRTAEQDRVSPSMKLAYGLGGLTDFFYLNVLLGLANQIYVTGMKLDPALLGIALAIPKAVGAIADPIVGAYSDNTRGAFGRRRPYILIGGVAGAILLPLMWCVPPGSQIIRFAYVAGLISILSAFYSVFSIPYSALGYELTTDYDERTRVLAWKGYVQTAGTFSAAWFYWFCSRKIFGDVVVGARWLSVIAGAVMALGALATVWACREKTERRRQAKVPLGEALRLTLRNRPFLLLQASAQTLATALAITGTIGWFVYLYYVCRGSESLAAYIAGVGGTLTIFASLAGIPLGLWISTRLGKREATLAGLTIVAFSFAILPIALTPAHPWWSVIVWMITALGTPITALMFGSMTADICDDDELETGLRREGAYGAVNGFFGKITQIATLLIGGLLPRWAGYANTALPPTPELMLRMKWALIAVQFCGVLLALALFWFYPITRARSEETRHILSRRKEVQQPSLL